MSDFGFLLGLLCLFFHRKISQKFTTDSSQRSKCSDTNCWKIKDNQSRTTPRLSGIESGKNFEELKNLAGGSVYPREKRFSEMG